MSAAWLVSGGAELSARGEKDGEGEGRAGGGEHSAGERLLGEASGQGGTRGLSDADREDQPRVRLAGPARQGEGIGGHLGASDHDGQARTGHGDRGGGGEGRGRSCWRGVSAWCPRPDADGRAEVLGRLFDFAGEELDLPSQR